MSVLQRSSWCTQHLFQLVTGRGGSCALRPLMRNVFDFNVTPLFSRRPTERMGLAGKEVCLVLDLAHQG